jgi:MATE family multidrug resistance protein
LSQAASSGDTSLAAIQIVLVIFGFIAFGLDGFAHATEALAGAAIGSGSRPKLQLIIKRTTLLAALAAAIMSAGLILLQGLIIPVMTSQPPLQAAVADLWLWCVLIPPVSFLAFQMDGVYVGAAASHYMRNGMFASFALFAGLIFTFASAGLDGLMFAFIVYLLARGIYLALYLRHMFDRYVGDSDIARTP